MVREYTRKPDPSTLDSDEVAPGSEVIGPGLPKFDSDHIAPGSAVKDYTSKKADASKGGKSLQTVSGTSGLLILSDSDPLAQFVRRNKSMPEITESEVRVPNLSILPIRF